MNIRPTRPRSRGYWNNLINLTAGVILGVILAPLAAGFTVLSLEIVGTKMLAPFFGSDIRVWAAQIGMTLVALAVGYRIGGSLSARPDRLSILGMAMAGAGAWITVVPYAKTTVLSALLGLSWYPAIIASAFALYFVPLVLLAIVPVIAIEVKSRHAEGDTAGKASGDIYFISTLGSVAGAYASVFIALQYSLSAFFTVSGIGLLLLATAILALSKKTGSYAVPSTIVTAVLLGFVSLAAAPADFGETDGITGIERAYTLNGFVEVIENPQFRFLVVNSAVQSAIDKRSDRIHPYFDALFSSVAVLAESVPTPGRRALVIGLGAGNVVRKLRNAGYEVETVEIEPEVLRLAQTYFGFVAEPGRDHIADGRYFVNTTDRKFDLIFLDAYSGFGIAEHLFTREAFRSMKKILTEDGVVVCNLVDHLDSENSRRVLGTMKNVFGAVAALAFQSEDSRKREEFDNILAVAGRNPVDIESRREQVLSLSLENLNLTGTRVIAVPVTDFGEEVTDDRNGLNGNRDRLSRKLLLSRARELRKL